MSEIMPNPVSMAASYAVPAVYSPQPLAPVQSSVAEGGNRANVDMGFAGNSAAQSSGTAYSAETSASFAEPMAFGDNDAQMSGFVSYLNQGPAMHAKSGSLDNLSSLFG